MLLLGLVSVVLYWLVAARPFLLLEHIDRPGLHIGTVADYALEDAVRFTAGFGALFALYVAAYRLLARRPLPGGAADLLVVLGPAAVAHALVALIYPIVAGDMFDYVLYGRMLAAGFNPLTSTPNDFRPDPYVVYSPWPGEPSVYGPLWAILSMLPTALARDNLVVGLLLFKLIAVAASLVTAVAVWGGVRRQSPDRAALGALLVAWNPLVVWEVAGNGHNDMVMVCLAALALWALVAGRVTLAAVLLTASALVKFVTVLLAPLFLIWAVRLALMGGGRRIWRGIGLGLLGSALVAGAAYAPFWAGADTFPFLTRRGWFTASLPTLLRHVLVERWGLTLDAAGARASAISGYAFGVAYLLVLGNAARGWARYGLAALARDWYLIYFVYLVVACTWFQAWYLLWLLPAMAVLADERWHDLTALFSFGALASYLWYWIWGLSKTHMDYITIMSIMVAIIFPLPLVYGALAFSAGRQRSAEADA